MTIELFQTGIQQGLVLALVAFGIMIPFRFLNVADLTCEGSYALAGSLCACLIALNLSPLVAMFLAVGASGLLGLATYQIAFRMNVYPLLAGIILTTMTYSINLRVMGKPNVSLFGMLEENLNAFFLMVIVIFCMLPFFFFLYTDFGLRFRASGLNSLFAQRRGLRVHSYKSLGFFLAGCFAGVAGCLMIYLQQFADVGMGVGIVIHGLASLMVGEAIVGTHTLAAQLIAPFIGALIYQQIQGLVLFLGLAPSDIRLFTGITLLLLLELQRSGSHDS